MRLLFEGGDYNIQGLAGGGYYSRASTIRGRRLIEEIRYLKSGFGCRTKSRSGDVHPTVFSSCKTYTAHALMSVGCSAEGEQAGAALAAIPTNYLLVKPQLEKGHSRNAPKS